MKAFAVAARVLKVAALWAIIIPVCLAGTLLAAVIAASIAALCGLVCTVVFVIIIVDTNDTISFDYLVSKASDIVATAKTEKGKRS
jgi:hypothetical protein